MRRAGILLHPTSLPGPGPCGTIGDNAVRFLDWLHDAGCTMWQVLPLTMPGAGFSPYDSPSAFAGGTHLIDVDRLVRDGLLDAVGDRPPAGRHVDVDAVWSWHAHLVDAAADRLAAREPDALDGFSRTHPWVTDWATFRALCRSRGVDGWQDLAQGLRRRWPSALSKATERLRPQINREIAAQIIFWRQWSELRLAARDRGIQILGDVPIFVSAGSTDVWARRHLFRGFTDDEKRWHAHPVAGVPPDYFSPIGQRWGNPHYDWHVHGNEHYDWWRARMRTVLELVDRVRIDHFRGFCAAWEIPHDAADARAGAWAPGPGRAVFDALREEFGHMPLIAEDLGEITPDVDALRDTLGLPGMKILQFAFGDEADHAFLPHNYTHPNWVAYTGTHDNDTAAGWYAQAPDAVKHRYRVYTGRDGGSPGWDLIRLAWASTANDAIAPLQDVLGLDSSHRMNIPGNAQGNWTWRTTELPQADAWRLREMAWAYGRVAPD